MSGVTTAASAELSANVLQPPWLIDIAQRIFSQTVITTFLPIRIETREILTDFWMMALDYHHFYQNSGLEQDWLIVFRNESFTLG